LRRSDRLAWVPGILGWAESLGVTWHASVRRRVEDGLSPGPDGEDEFDAVIGLLGVIAVVTGALDTGEPRDDPAITATEGWILGRPAVRTVQDPVSGADALDDPGGAVTLVTPRRGRPGDDIAHPVACAGSTWPSTAP
jgi:hypothetical protein